MIVQNAAINIGSLGNLKPTVDLSLLKMHIIIITWIGALKNKSVHDWLGKRVVDQDWVDYEEGNKRKYVWQEGQWCLGCLTRSQKRRVHA